MLRSRICDRTLIVPAHLEDPGAGPIYASLRSLPRPSNYSSTSCCFCCMQSFPIRSLSLSSPSPPPFFFHLFGSLIDVVVVFLCLDVLLFVLRERTNVRRPRFWIVGPTSLFLSLADQCQCLGSSPLIIPPSLLSSVLLHHFVYIQGEQEKEEKGQVWDPPLARACEQRHQRTFHFAKEGEKEPNLSRAAASLSLPFSLLPG